MELEFGHTTIHFPPFIFSLIAISIFYFLYKWSKELEDRKYTIFLYFLISTYIAPLYSRSTENGDFELWFPLGFTVVILYLLRHKKYHSAKMKASLLGVAVAIYRLIKEYSQLL
ncbi:hypothetical protein ACFYKX_05025 [Cytobacillus sp. FJAT-54145]|uniref:Glycosyltransferase RgtA/B/C/D-like domain-containing protein n=1 Tax=Cytobacillus spartinae TaxID=3299023 RepID=A0ABW6K8C2_9BACI